MASNVMGFGCRSRIPHRSFVGFSSLIRLPNCRSVSIRPLLWELAFPLGTLLPVFHHEFHVEREALELLDEHVEGLRRAGLEEVLTLDHRLVDADAALHPVALARQHLLRRPWPAVPLVRPHLHPPHPPPPHHV